MWEKIQYRRSKFPGKLTVRRHPSILLKSKTPWGFSGRPVPQKVMFFIYRVLRWFYVSIWFYFFPFLVLCVMYIIPILEKEKTV